MFGQDAFDGFVDDPCNPDNPNGNPQESKLCCSNTEPMMDGGFAGVDCFKYLSVDVSEDKHAPTHCVLCTAIEGTVMLTAF